MGKSIAIKFVSGLILSGNEISQILSLILTYYGGSGHRPRWIAIGVGLSALSCLVLALPHFLYGPGRDALALTKEYLDQTLLNATTVPQDLAICPRVVKPDHCDEETMLDVSILPRLLVFLSQFILGIGTTLYYGLGQTYLDDNTKKKNTPMLLGKYVSIIIIIISLIKELNIIVYNKLGRDWFVLSSNFLIFIQVLPLLWEQLDQQ